MCGLARYTGEVAEATLREKNQQERKLRVLMAAMQLAATGGYDAVQMRDVAADSGVALGTIYRYFGSKDELLLAGFARWVRFTRNQLRNHGPVGATPAQRVANALAAAMKKSDEQPLLMEALITATSNNEPDNLHYKVAIDEGFSGIISDAVGDEPGINLEGVERVLGHVWLSASIRWVSGIAPSGSVAEELRHAVSLLLPDDELASNELIDLAEEVDQESGWVSSSMQAEAGTAGLNR